MQERIVCVGEIYRHFKNKLYQIVAVAKHSETGERLVIYQQLYGRFEVYARPYEMFVSEVDHEKYPAVTQRYRFELVDRDDLEKGQEAGALSKGLSENRRENILFHESEEKKEAGQPERITAAESERMPEQPAASPVVPDGSVNPYLLRFLEADTYEDKRNILVRIRGELTDRMIDDIAASMDVTVEQGEIYDRYKSLLNCLDMMAKYEVNRFR